MKRIRFYVAIIVATFFISFNATAEYTRPVIRESLLSWSSWHAYCCIIYREKGTYTVVHNRTIRTVLKEARSNKKWAKKKVKKLKLNKMSNKKAVYRICEYIEDHYDYDSSQAWLEMAIKSHRANCTAYADLFYVLCKARKIPVRYIRGNVEGGSHCWNQVKINKKWYWVDTCWGYRPRRKLWSDHYTVVEIW